jgi:hypothetical protein
MIKRLAACLGVVAFVMALSGGTASADRDHGEHDGGVAPAWIPVH